MSNSKAFYEGLIYATADRIREKDGVYKLASAKEFSNCKADIYVDTVEKILAILKEDENKSLNLRSLQQKMDAMSGKKRIGPGSFFPDETLDDSEIQFILNCLEESRHIQAFGNPMQYKLPINYWVTRQKSKGQKPNKSRRGFYEILPLLTLSLGIALIYEKIRKK